VTVTTDALRSDT